MKLRDYKRYIGYGRTVKSNGAQYYCHENGFVELEANAGGTKVFSWEKINSWGAAIIHELFSDKSQLVKGPPLSIQL